MYVNRIGVKLRRNCCIVSHMDDVQCTIRQLKYEQVEEEEEERKKKIPNYITCILITRLTNVNVPNETKFTFASVSKTGSHTHIGTSID